MKYIDAEKLKAELRRQKHELELSIQSQGDYGQSCHIIAYENILSLIESLADSLQQDVPDKKTILRICKLHKAWSIMAPWENVEDFIMTNWNSENIV